MIIHAHKPANRLKKQTRSIAKKVTFQKERTEELKHKYCTTLFLDASLASTKSMRNKKPIKKHKKSKIPETNKRLSKIKRHCQGLKSQLLDIERINLKKYEQCLELKEKIKSIELFIEKNDKKEERNAEVTTGMIEEVKQLIERSEIKNKEKETQLVSQITHLRSVLFKKKCKLTALETTSKEKDILCRSTLTNLKRLKKN